MRDEPRKVRPFVTLEAADLDRRERGRAVLFDLHGLWWSVPLELTIHDVNSQVLDELAHMDLSPFHDQPWRQFYDRPGRRPYDERLPL